MRALIALALLGTACIRNELVICDDGRACPTGTQCDLVHQTCVTAEQATVCAGLPEGAVCRAGNSTGICDLGYCLPGCGDGEQATGEECDDGNFTSHDGCSSACRTEFAGWSQWRSEWIGRYAHVAAFVPDPPRLVIASGTGALGNLGDTWARYVSSAAWSYRGTIPARSRSASAYDPVRKRLVVFGGQSAGVPLAETWELDPVTEVWTLLTPATSPPARLDAMMVYDPRAERALLFGGRTATATATNETWEWDGSTWRQVVTTGTPPAIGLGAFAWDPGASTTAADDRAVLFSGYTSTGMSAETWTYVPSNLPRSASVAPTGTWTLLPTTGAPESRFGAVFAHLPPTTGTGPGKLVLHGGSIAAGTSASDTWELVASTWTAPTQPTSPSNRTQSTLTYVPTLQRLILVGGRNDNGTPFDDVWEYDGAIWKDASPSLSPAARSTPAVYNSTRRVVVLYGGLAPGGGPPYGDTWTFDGAYWREQAPGGSPSPGRYGPALAHDSARQRDVLFGGRSSTTSLDDTWVFANDTWQQLQPAVKPSARYAAGISDHGGGVLLFGGIGANNARLADTWELDGDVWVARTTPQGLVPPVRPSLAYDSEHQQVVMIDAAGVTWTYRDHAWQVHPASALAGDTRVTTYDPWRKRVVTYEYGRIWELVRDAWQPVQLLGAQPPTRTFPAVAPLPGLQALVLFGGVGYDDTWLLRYVSDTPDEKCANGEDDDRDRQIDGDDPDCGN